MDGSTLSRFKYVRTGKVERRGFHHYEWCFCSGCGERKAVRLKPDKQLRSSSGCWKCVRTLHGHTAGGVHSRTFRSWRSMLDRCENPNNGRFDRYGLRGIRVCERWQTFENFLADLGERPPGKSLERKDNDGCYEPDNVKWATPAEQNRNMSTTVMLTYDGETMCMADWARRLRLNPATLHLRRKKGLPVAQILAPKRRL